MRAAERRGRGPLSWLAALARAAAFAAAACAASCSLGMTESEKELPEAPYAVFVGYSHTVVVRGARNFVLKADKAELYEKSKKAVLSGVSFSEYDPDTGELLSRGTAEGAVYHTDTKDAEFSGSVRLESKRQDAILEGEKLSWIDKDKRLLGGLDRTVTIGREDGSRVSGAGFEADASDRSFSFRGGVSGLVADKESAPEKEAAAEERPAAAPGAGTPR
jgi:LPS export ABC transporter protein LptC